MFNWYRNAARCYVYLDDVSAGDYNPHRRVYQFEESEFLASRWFTRGWALQELLAPATVEFFSREGKRLGDKRSLERQIHKTTGIAILALRGTPLSQFSVDERLKWAENRQTTLEEDWAYSLLGIFGVFMEDIYGEGRAHAVMRLRRRINEKVIDEDLKDKDRSSGKKATKLVRKPTRIFTSKGIFWFALGRPDATATKSTPLLERSSTTDLRQNRKNKMSLHPLFPTEVLVHTRAQTEHRPSITPPKPIPGLWSPYINGSTSQDLLTFQQDQWQQRDSEASTSISEPAERSTSQSFRSCNQSNGQIGPQEYTMDKFYANMNQGLFFSNRRKSHDDTVTAGKYFLRARNILESVNPSDFASLVEVYCRLASAELFMSCTPWLGLGEKESHLRKAEIYGDIAFEKARLSEDPGNLARTRLEKAFLKARGAEIEAKKRGNTQEMRRLEEEARQAISDSLQELNDANYPFWHEYSYAARHWQGRLVRLNAGQ